MFSFCTLADHSVSREISFASLAEEWLHPPPEPTRLAAFDTRHARGMSVTKPKFACDRCIKTFTRKANLLDHISSVHDPTATKFPCAKCSNTFGRKSDRDRHERRQHGEHRYTCGDRPEDQGTGCGQTFARLDALKEHRRTRKCATGRHQNASNNLGQELHAIAASVPSIDTGSRDSTPARNDIEQTATTNGVDVVRQTLSPHNSTHPLTSTLYWDGWYQGTPTPPQLSPGSSKAEQLLANLSLYLIHKIENMPRNSASDQPRVQQLTELHARVLRCQRHFERYGLEMLYWCKPIVARTLVAISDLCRAVWNARDASRVDLLVADAMKHLADIAGAHILTGSSCLCEPGFCVCDFMSWVDEEFGAGGQDFHTGLAPSADLVQAGATASANLSDPQDVSPVVVSYDRSNQRVEPSRGQSISDTNYIQESPDGARVSQDLWPGWTVAADESAKYTSDSFDDIGQLHENLVWYVNEVLVEIRKLPRPTSSDNRRMDALLSLLGAVNDSSRTFDRTERAKSLCRAIGAVVATILLEALVAISPQLPLRNLFSMGLTTTMSDAISGFLRTIVPIRLRMSSKQAQFWEDLLVISDILRPATSVSTSIQSSSMDDFVWKRFEQLTPRFLSEYWRYTSFEPGLAVKRRMYAYYQQELDLVQWRREDLIRMAKLTVGGAGGDNREDNADSAERGRSKSVASISDNEFNTFPDTRSSDHRAPRIDDGDRDDSYNTVLYDLSFVSNSQANSDMRKKAAFDALDEFFGQAKERRPDPPTYFDSNVSSSDHRVPRANEKELSESSDPPHDLRALRLPTPWSQRERYFGIRLQKANEGHLQAASRSTAMDRDAAMGLLMVANTPTQSTDTNSSAWRAHASDDTNSTGSEKQQIKHQCCSIAFGSVQELVSHVQRMHGSELMSSR